MDTPTIEKVITILRKEVKQWDVPIVTLVAQHSKDPFKVLMATVLSLRTKDEVTAMAAKRLFAIADTPKKVLTLSQKEIEKIIYPVGFYRIKSKNILLICKKLLDEFDGKVPKDIPTLLEFPNVGRKTANLVLSDGFDIPAMTVDIHVFRISNRLGKFSTEFGSSSLSHCLEGFQSSWQPSIGSFALAFQVLPLRPGHVAAASSSLRVELTAKGHSSIVVSIMVTSASYVRQPKRFT